MIYDALNYLAFYIWDWGISLLASILFIVLIRIFIAFVFKIFRFNVNYTTMQDRMNRNSIANDPRRDKSPRS